MTSTLDYQKKKLDVQRELGDTSTRSSTDEGDDAPAEEGLPQKILSLPPGYYEREVSIRERVVEEPIMLPAAGWRLEHHVSTNITQIYDDNIFNEQDDEKKDDFITSVVPTLRLDILGNNLYVTSNQKIAARYYWDFGEDLVDYTGGTQIVYNASPRMRFIFSETYSKKHVLKEVEGTDIFTTNQTVDRIDNNKFLTRGEYELIRGGNVLWFDYEKRHNGVRNHGRGNNLHSTGQDFGMGLTHSFSPRTSVSPAYTFRSFSNRKNKASNYNAHGLRLGFEHSLAPILKAQGIAGFEFRDFYKRQGKGETARVNVGLTSRISRLTTLELDYDFDQLASYLSTGEYDRHRFGAGIYHQLAPFVRVSGSTVYTSSVYSSGSEDDMLTLGTDMHFTVGRRLTTSLSYRHKMRDAAGSAGDYEDNVYMISVDSLFW